MKIIIINTYLLFKWRVNTSIWQQNMLLQIIMYIYYIYNKNDHKIELKDRKSEFILISITKITFQ